MLTPEDVETIMKDFKNGLTIDGRSNVFELNKELKSDDILEKSKPEEYTKTNLIEKIFKKLNCKITAKERIFESVKNTKREVDYTIETKSGNKFIVEAKPLGADLYQEIDSGAVRQIKDALILSDVVEEFPEGIATDGNHWVFINSKREVVQDASLDNDLKSISAILSDGESIESSKKEDISKKFYLWYSSILYGGTYKGHDKKKHTISSEDCLINSVQKVDDESVKKRIAQTTIDRLIFIKFLESKKIIKQDITKYLSELEPDRLNPQLKSLFFDVMNTDLKDRDNDINPAFKDIPYLNGSLFIRTSAETNNPDYKIKTPILKEIFHFLNSFRFRNRNENSEETLDPEILGYIFEMSMTSENRKDTGAFYTPKEITSYMSKKAILSSFISKVKKYISDNQTDPNYSSLSPNEINSIDDFLKLNDIKRADMFKLLPQIKICDNACGSGAFLLAAAEELFNLYKIVSNNTGLRNTDVVLKKLILNNNIYGVDLNQNAVEIAKLRLWLWLVDSYNIDYVDPLPNIEYNIRCGNSLIGFTDLKDEVNKTINIDDYAENGKSVKVLLHDRSKLVQKYKSMSGEAAHKQKRDIEELSIAIRKKLTQKYYTMNAGSTSCSSDDFLSTRPFHWGFEFSDVMNAGGFDIILGNPPYIQLQKMKDDPAYEYYKIGNFDTFNSMGDIYCLFYERSNDILCNGGICSYITSNKWMKARYGEDLRNYFITDTDPVEIIDLAGLKIFKDATVESGIFSFKSREKISRTEISVKTCQIDEYESIKNMSDFVEHHHIDSTFSLSNSWALCMPIEEGIRNKIDKFGKKLADWDLNLYRGITTGLNEAFIIDEETKNRIISKDPKSSEIIKPILRGRDIARYRSDFAGMYVITTFPSKNIDIEEYPAVKAYLESFDIRILSQSGEKNIDGIEGKNARKKTNNKWFETQDQIGYWDDFSKYKIAWIDLSDCGRFSLIPPDTMLLNTTFFFSINDPYYLLGVLNSKLITWYFSFICSTSGVGTNRWIKQFVEKIPIPTNPKNKEKISELAKMLFDDPHNSKYNSCMEHEVCVAYNLDSEQEQYLNKLLQSD